MSSIDLINVTLKRNEQLLFEGLNLSLAEHRIGVIGRNGAGKSSLLQLSNGLLQPSHGQVISHGIDTHTGPQALARTIGYVFQNPDHQMIFPTVAEEFTFSLQQSGVESAQARQQALDYLSHHQRSHWADRSVMTLSEGQKQWLCIHAILIMKPRTLILDEPYAALDLAGRFALSALLNELSQQVLLITHELDPLAQFDRILWLDSGEIRADGPPADVLPQYRADALAQSQSHAEILQR
jgi:biotin transport system ATP-binding protein